MRHIKDTYIYCKTVTIKGGTTIMQKKRYCFIIELKEEHVEEYKNIHKNQINNAHKKSRRQKFSKINNQKIAN